MQVELRLNTKCSDEHVLLKFKKLFIQYANIACNSFRAKNMNKELLNSLHTSWDLKQVINIIANSIIVNHVGSNYIFRTDSSIKSPEGISLDNIIRFIDYGTLNVKGIMLIKDSFVYAKDNLLIWGGII